MRKIIIMTTLAIALCLSQVAVSVAIASSGEAKQAWSNAQQFRSNATEENRQAKLNYASDKTSENNQKLINANKVVLSAVLDEAEAWLIWKNVASQENPEIPNNLKEAIKSDVNANLGKINELRSEVDNIKTRLEAGVVFIKMIGDYANLLSDTARNTGLVWVHLGNKRVDLAENYEIKLRETAMKVNDNTAIIGKLDIAKAKIKTARENVKSAEVSYNQIKIPGTPFLKFKEGNNHLRQAKVNLVDVILQLEQAFNLIIHRK